MVKTRNRERLEEKWKQDYLFARPSDPEVRELQNQFKSDKPPRVPRIKRQRDPPFRNKVTLKMAKTIYELRHNLGYSYDRISRMVYCALSTAHAAYRRYDELKGDFEDRRKYNGRKNPRVKIVPRVRDHLLNPKVL